MTDGPKKTQNTVHGEHKSCIYKVSIRIIDYSPLPKKPAMSIEIIDQSRKMG